MTDLKVVRLSVGKELTEDIAKRFETVAKRIREEGDVVGCAIAVTFRDGSFGTEYDAPGNIAVLFLALEDLKRRLFLHLEDQ